MGNKQQLSTTGWKEKASITYNFNNVLSTELRNAAFIVWENIGSLRVSDKLVDFHKASYISSQQERHEYIVIKYYFFKERAALSSR